MTLITLTTDFGLKDGNVGVMKGVIWSRAPQAQIVDLSHLISPQNVREASLILGRALPYFPDGTVYVVVVDPGVGTERRPIAVRLGEQFLVGPDNGVFTLAYEYAETQDWPLHVVLLDRPQYWLPQVSYVFHGRDVFAPVAGSLAAGVPLEELGRPIYDPVRIDFPQPEAIDGGLRGEIIHIDHFGNLSSCILRQHLGERPGATIRISGVNIHGMVKTFGERPDGELIALYGSSGNLIVSVVNGDAAKRLGARLGDKIEVFF